MLLVSMNVMTSLWRATSLEAPSRSTRVPHLPILLLLPSGGIEAEIIDLPSDAAAATKQQRARNTPRKKMPPLPRKSIHHSRSFARSLVRSLVCTH